ncbi:hypothetical protein AB835_13840 [Candidatus Endobugula sertula]|uniref:Condensation domain-containing protein n=1 Tax=Candidatus Endobugula sertula TaxID=62101 RepID=A0A1D2QLP4_9GAMM|nr:hypothetical protein AB835_13840 [Candidatus Endobugula sertula]
MYKSIKELLANNPVNRPPTITSADKTKTIPLSYIQKPFWFAQKYIKRLSTSYNTPLTLHFYGKNFSVDIMRDAFNDLVARHGILRTNFITQGYKKQPQQIIRDSLALEIPLLDVKKDQIKLLFSEHINHVFDLANEPLIKIFMLRIKNDHHIVMINIHHIVTDGWSQGIIVRDLKALYNARLTGEAADLPTLSIQYADYSVWQHQQSFDTDLAYWQQSLKGYEDDLSMPCDYSSSESQAWHAAVIKYTYPKSLSRRLSDYCQTQQASLFMGLLTGLAIIIADYADKEDICICTTGAGRDKFELENLIGPFVNVLPMRIDLAENPSFEEVLHTVRRLVLDGFEHQHSNLMNEPLVKPAYFGQIPLTSIFSRHQNFPRPKIKEWPEGVVIDEADIEVELEREWNIPSKLDWQFLGDGTDLELNLIYAAELFSKETVECFITHYQQALEILANTPQAHLSDRSVSLS